MSVRRFLGTVPEEAPSRRLLRADLFPRESGSPRYAGRTDDQRSPLSQPRWRNVLTWRDRDLGYALVSRLNAAELTTLAARLAAPPIRP